MAASLFEGERAIDNPGAPLLLRAPLRLCAVGASGSGKTTAVLQCVVLPELSPFGIVVWAAPAASLRQVKLANAKALLDERAAARGLAEGLILVPCDDGIDTRRIEDIVDEAFELGLASLIVFDDLLFSKKDDHAYMANLFVNGRHRLVSVCECRQRVFGGSSVARDTRLQCNAFILAKFGQADEVRRLAGQICAGKAEAERMTALWARCVAAPHGFLLVDLQGDGPFRFRDSGLARGFR